MASRGLLKAHALHTIGRYHLLILDSHGSHVGAELDYFCKNHPIIPLYMSSHSSHCLQPLDVSCFAPLKQVYKQSFLTFYQYSQKKALSADICSGFSAIGLVPYNPQQVVDCLEISKKITPPNTSHGIWTAKTPRSTQEVQQ